MTRIWRFVASVRVTLWLLALGAITLFLGSFSVKANPRLYGPLNYMLLQDWLREHAGNGFTKVGWFILLASLLFLLGVNTAACVLDRLSLHWRRRRSTGFRLFATRVLPTLVHACFGVILLGHLSSLVFGYRSTVPLRSGSTIVLPQGASVLPGNRRASYYPPPFGTSLREYAVPLALREGGAVETMVIAIGRPIFWHGFQMHLLQAGRPAAGESPPLQLVIRHDPGLGVILGCFPILIALMLLYYYLTARAMETAEPAAKDRKVTGIRKETAAR